MMTVRGREVGVIDACAQLPELLEHVRQGDVVYLTQHGRRVGAVVSADFSARLEELEDLCWSRRAEDVLAKGEPTVSWDAAVELLEAEDFDT
jgi:prevent-host-death family protein